MKTYSELIRIPSFEERFAYLKLDGRVAEETFGFDRWMNQQFYHSSGWKRIRDQVIVRDLGCDLGLDGYEIYGSIIIHHMNPVTMIDLIEYVPEVFNPNYLICTSLRTHNAIHYGDQSLLPSLPKIRSRNDTCPWKV